MTMTLSTPSAAMRLPVHPHAPGPMDQTDIPAPASLSVEEETVLHLIMSGYSTRRIAEAMACEPQNARALVGGVMADYCLDNGLQEAMRRLYA